MRSNKRSAYTLIELLVVVVILVTLIAITLPLAKKVMEDSYTREASRQLSSFFAQAKIQAVRTGRPWGLYMQCELPVGVPTTSTLRQVTKVYLAEVQAPYSGATLGARGGIYNVNNVRQFLIVDLNGQQDLAEMNYLCSAGNPANPSPLLSDGETCLVRFDYKGEWYRCQRSGTQLLYLGSLHGLQSGTNPFYPIPPGFNDNVAPYEIARPFQILRGPRRVGNPLELTSGTCIDVAYCGIGPSGSGFPPDSGATISNVQALTVMFTAAGGVEGVYVNTSPCTPQGTVHFLVGRVEKVTDPLGDFDPAEPTFDRNMFDPANSNLADPTSLWVSVSRSTGTVTTSENLPPSLVTGSTSPNLNYQYYDPWQASNQTAPLNTGNAADRQTFLKLCRQIAIGREQMGGR
jgi:prepilin-type N-terminal cleavage/methylation domain-containing protein